jgi:hypothetical protein
MLWINCQQLKNLDATGVCTIGQAQCRGPHPVSLLQKTKKIHPSANLDGDESDPLQAECGSRKAPAHRLNVCVLA